MLNDKLKQNQIGGIKMNSSEKKMEKSEMKNIHAGAEKSGSVKGTIGQQPGSACAFKAGTCCQRTENCPTNSRTTR